MHLSCRLAVVVITLLGLFGVCQCDVSGDSFGEKGETLALTFLGTVGGRTFFRAENTTANYAASKTRCESQGLFFPNINTPTEVAYLRGIIDRVYWTSGISDMTFKWADGTNIVVDIQPSDPTCLYITEGSYRLQDYNCNSANVFYTLCASSN